ncbi:cysteine hydrolase family protein [Aciditerrimonas ferrireducens]|uniref:Cysteine hydrolase family protein n=1 Tax=Aciditerrimonas ferrireducens TaxID=667306 RepID=A0ABV6C2Y5_9ACTN
MTTGEELGREDFRRALRSQLVLDPATTAVVTVDCHRGHLDPGIATMPVPPQRARKVVDAAGRLVRGARARGVQVVHVVLQTRLLADGRVESMANPFWRAVEQTRQSLTPDGPSTVRGHNLEGSPQTQLVPELGPEPTDLLVTTKRRLSIFRDTDLELLLRGRGATSVVLCGINTNTCVLCAAFEAFNRDLRVVVAEDAVASMYGEDLHRFGLATVARCLGWVLPVDEILDVLGAARSASLAGPTG